MNNSGVKAVREEESGHVYYFRFSDAVTPPRITMLGTTELEKVSPEQLVEYLKGAGRIAKLFESKGFEVIR